MLTESSRGFALLPAVRANSLMPTTAAALTALITQLPRMPSAQATLIGPSKENFLPSSVSSHSSSSSSSFGAQEICTFEQWTQLPSQPGAFRIFSLISLLAMLVIIVVGGNALVIAAVLMRRRLRTATGMLILSLAVADMLVGLVVLPFSIANEVLNGFWIFGDIWCTAWLTIDIWMCTSSVYNLVAISIDRYIAIIKPLNYHMMITKFRARFIVAFVWISSFIVCSPSFLLASSERKSYIEQQMAKNGTKSAHEFVLHNPEACRCTPSNSGMYYILFSASSSFYIPMIIVIFVYARIYLAAMAATKSQYAGMVQVAENANKKHSAEKHQQNNCNSESKANVIRASTLKLPKLFGSKVARDKHQFEMYRFNKDPPRSVPISLNCTSMPTVYAQVNGSCNNLKYGVPNNSTNFDRRRSEDKLIPKERFNMRISLVRRSIPSEVAYKMTKERPSLCPNAKMAMDSSDSNDSSNASGDESKSMLVPNNCCGAAETTEANGNVEGRETAPQSTLPTTTVPNEQADSQPHTTLLHAQNNTASSPQSSQKSGKSSRNFATSLLMRILGKAKRKRAGGTYEKRLSLEIKAAKTVAIVTGCFIFCWLGFSIYYGLTAFDVYVNEVIWSIFFWLGYLNSAFNPIIYTVFNREFRTCFKQLLTCNNMIFASNRGAANQVPMCNSFNSQLRLGNDPMIRSKAVEQSDA